MPDYTGGKQNNPRLDSGTEQQIQRRVRQELAQAKASGNVALYFASKSWFPTGYMVDDKGALKYVQVNQSRPALLNPKVAIPMIVGAGLGLGALPPNDGGLSASVGAPAALEKSIFGSAAAKAGNAAALGSLGATAAETAGKKAGEQAGKSLGEKALETGLNAIPPLAGLSGSDEKTTSPEAQALLDQQRARLMASNPLYESVLKLAMSRMPTNTSEGLSIPDYASVENSLGPMDNAGKYNEDPATRSLLRLQLARSKMADPLNQALLRLAKNRMPVGFGG